MQNLMHKVRDGFDISVISGKRDYAILNYETEGFVKIDDRGNIVPIDHLDSEESKVKNDLIHSKIKVK